MTDRVWRIDCRPAGNVTSSDYVGHPRMAAGNTGESRLIGTILFINTTAYRAGSRSIARINSDYLNPVQDAFVLDKRAQLRESPSMQSSPLGAPDRNPFADILKVFKGNSASGAFKPPFAIPILIHCLDSMLFHEIFCGIAYNEIIRFIPSKSC